MFAYAVELGRLHGTDDALPDFVEPSYAAALSRMKPLTIESLAAREWTKTEFAYLLAACAVFCGKPELGYVLDGLSDLCCPDCGASLAPK